MKYAWIAKHKGHWPVSLSCEVLDVSASGYFEHWRRKDTDKPSRAGANMAAPQQRKNSWVRSVGEC